MRSVLIALLALAFSPASLTATELIMKGPFESSVEPLPSAEQGTPETMQIEVWVDDVQGLRGLYVAPRFISKTGADATCFSMPWDDDEQTGGNPHFGYYFVTLSEFTLEDIQTGSSGAGEGFVYFDVADARAKSFSEATLILTITYNYDENAAGPYLIDAYCGTEGPTEVVTTLREGDQKGVPFFVTRGRVHIGDDLKVWYVDVAGDDEAEGTSSEHALATIQEAVSRANDGDVIILNDGTYTGEGNRDVYVPAKSILITSLTDAASCTISIGASFFDSHRAFYLKAVGPCFEIRKLTIRGGYCGDPDPESSASDPLGGAILGAWSCPTIRECHFIENNAFNRGTALAGGGAIAFQSWDFDYETPILITKNTFDANLSQGYGGAVYVDNVRAVIEYNVFSGNSALKGGATAINDSGGCVFRGNDARYNSGIGGGLYVGGDWSTGARISENFIAMNGSNKDLWTTGGGICIESCSPTITNNEISQNTASIGGGIYCKDGFPIVTNNTIVANAAHEGYGGGVYHASFPYLVIQNCLLWYNGNTLYNCEPYRSCFEGAIENDGSENTAGFPHFADPPAGDFRLKSYSPCIDAGDSGLTVEGDADADSNPRVLFDDVDIGAYESLSRSEDSDSDGLPDDWEMEHFGDLDEAPAGDDDDDGTSNYEEFTQGTPPAAKTTVVYVDALASDEEEDGSIDFPFNTIQEGVDLSVAIVYVAGKSEGNGGTYNEEVVVRNKSLQVLGGYDSTFETYDPATYPCTINPSSVQPHETGRAVTFVDCGYGVLKGFIITGGNAPLGGGIYCERSFVTISENAIEGNQALLGGGICIAKASGPTIASNVFRSNKATDGGAIACMGAYAVIDGNMIGAEGYPNEADRDGGGIYCREVTNTIIKNNVITWNEARGHGGGIAFYKCKLPTPRSPEKSCMHKNRITRNRASIGGGFSILNTSNWAAVWNVIAGNIAQAGAGLYVSGSTGSSAYVRALQNNTIADNSCDDPF